jgi:hypothetical protein
VWWMDIDRVLFFPIQRLMQSDDDFPLKRKTVER